jgi:tellurite resistance protein TerC
MGRGGYSEAHGSPTNGVRLVAGRSPPAQGCGDPSDDADKRSPRCMLDVSVTGWAVTIGLIVVLLAVDLGLSVRRPHEVGFREAAAWSLFYITAAISFGIALGLIAGWDYGSQYFAGYIVEKSLSIDNLFVFVIIMSAFAVPSEHQQRVLTIGIVIALVLRAVFIALGAALLATFSLVFVLFGLLLVVTGIQLFRHRAEDPSIEDNVLLGAVRRWLPVTDRYDGARTVTRQGGRRMLTPLALALIAIGGTDVLFALDSIPAVFGVTPEAYIVFAANAFALLGLRALFFLVAGLLDRLVYLSTGLAIILVFIGAKLILHYLHLQYARVPEISTSLSLVVLGVVLVVSTVASLLKTRRDPEARAHSGSLRRQRPRAPSGPR